MSENLNESTALAAEATEMGHERGWEHAAFVEAYGGDANEAPEIPARFASVATYYSAAHSEGVERYGNGQYSDGTFMDA
jgi:hypothetical protein